jgi:hypothetical protein
MYVNINFVISQFIILMRLYLEFMRAKLTLDNTIIHPPNYLI